MASIANLIVSMIADTGVFETDMNRTAKQQAARMKKFEKDAAQAAKAIGVAFAAVGAATVAVVAKSINAADAIGELSAKTGIGTVALSNFKTIAETSGVSIEQFTTGISKMQRSLVEAGQGTGAAADTLARLGLSIDDVLKLSPEDQFAAIAKEIANLGSAAERSAAAQQIFGRAGASLLPVMLDSAEFIGKVAEEMELFGAAISEEFAADADQFDKNMARLGIRATGLANTFTAALIPSLLDIQEGMLGTAPATDLAAEAGRRLGAVLKTLATAFVIVKEAALLFGRVLLGSVLAVFNAVRAAVSPITASILALGEALQKLAAGDFTGALEAIKDVPTRIASEFQAAAEKMQAAAGFLTETFTDELPAAIDRVNKFFNTNAEVVTSTAGAYKSLGDQTVKAADKLVKFVARSRAANKSIEENLKFVEELEQAQEEYNRQLQELNDIADPVSAIMREFGEQVEFANQALAKGSISAETYQKYLNTLSDQLGQTVADMQSLEQETTAMSVAVDESIRILERAFTDMWSNIGEEGLDVFDTLKDGFKTLLGSMVQQITTSKITEQLRNLFDADVSTIFNSKQFLEGLAGAAGVLGGSILGGGGQNAGIGAQLGGLIGSFVGPLGTAIGGVLGGLLGGLFDKDKPAVLQASSFDTSRLSGSDTDSSVESIFGKTFIRTRRLDQAAINSFKDALADFDNSIGSFLDESQITKIAGALEGWSKQIEGETLSAEELLNSRFKVILSTFSDDLQKFVNQAKDLEEQAARLQIGVGAEKLFADQPDLFGSRTVAEFLAVVDAFKTGTESISDAFRRVVELLDTVLAVKSSLADFAGSDLAGDFNLLLQRQAESVVQTVTRMTSELSAAMVNFDGSPEQLVQIGNLALSVRQQELNALALIDSVAKGLNANLDRLRKDTEATINGPRAAEDVLFDARALIATVSTASTPEEIARIGQQFEELIRSLSPEDTKAFGTSTLAIIDSFKLASQASLDRAERAVLDSGEAIRSLVEGFGNLIDPLELVAATNERAAAALELIAGVTAASTTEPEGYEEQARIISDGIDEALTSGVNNMSAQVVAAIRQGFGSASMNPTFVVRSGGLTNR